MIERDFITRTEWKEHLKTDWRRVHNLWPHLKDYVPGWGYSKAEIDAFFEGEDSGKKQVDWARITNKPGTFTPSAHTLVGAKHTASGLTIGHVVRATGATTFAWAQLQHGDLGGITSDQHHAESHTLASHSTKPHSALTDILSDQHHAQIHGSSHHSGGGDSIKIDDLATPDDNTDLNATTTYHGLLRKLTGSTSLFLRADGAWATPAAGAHAAQHEVGGGDLVSHDDLTDFSPAEHISHPGTIAAILSDHNVAAHNALGITTLGTVGTGVWQGTAIANAYIAGINQDLLITSDVYFNTVRSVRTAQVAGSSTFHMEVYSPDTGDPAKEVSIKFRQLDQYTFQLRARAGGFRFTAGDSDNLTSIRANSVGIGTTYYLNSLIANNKVEDSDKVDGEHAADIVTDGRVKAHFPDTIANILSDHTKVVHDNLGLDHAELSNILSGDHHAQIHAASHKSAGGDSIKLDEFATPDDNTNLNATTGRHGLLLKLTGSTSLYLRADGSWGTPAAGAHAGQHEVGGGDLVSHDDLTDFLAAEHKSLPNTIAQVLSDHDKAAHDALNIDADTLDSISSAGFLASAYLSGRSLSNPDSADVAGVTAYYLAASNGTHPPGTDHALLTLSFSNAWSVQMAGDWRTNNWYVRKQENTVWGSWVKLWHEGNDGATSGLDADKLDSLHATSFALTSRKLDDFGTPDDNTDLNATTGHHGLLRKLTGSTVLYLRADGAWAAPAPGAHAGQHEDGGGDLVHHDDLTDYVAGHHANHSAIQMIAGSGLSGGGYITADRTFNLGLLTAAWDAGSYQIRALKFYSDQATGVAPFTVLSTTKVTNLNADLLEGYHASSAAGNNTIVLRTGSGYIYCNYLNCTSGATTENPTHYFYETGDDSFLRQSTPANFVTQLAADGLARTTRALDTFGATTDITTLNATTSKHGLLMKLGGGTVNFLRADGAWAAPAGGGGLTTYFRTYRAAAQAFTTDTDTRVLWDTENYDIGGNVTTIFTAPATGYYYLHAAVMLNSLLSATAGYIRLRKTGPVVLAQERFTGPASLQTVRVTAQLYLTSGTWVEVTIYHNKGSNVNAQVGSSNTYFEGHRLDA